MTEPQAAPFLERLDAVQDRLARHRSAVHHGVTPPDDGGEERWTVENVWGHLVEFPAYWVAEAEGVAASYEGTPVPFGRTKRDPARRAAVDAGARGADAWPGVEAGIAAIRRFLGSLPAAGWTAVGEHSTLGGMPMPRIVEEFMVGHLEEHAEQLDGLADDPSH